MINNFETRYILPFDVKIFTKIMSCFEIGTPTRNQNRMSPTLGASENPSRNDNCQDRQFVVIVSEKQARIVGLPSQTCIHRQQLADTEFVVKSEVIAVRGKVYLTKENIVFII